MAQTNQGANTLTDRKKISPRRSNSRSMSKDFREFQRKKTATTRSRRYSTVEVNLLFENKPIIAEYPINNKQIRFDFDTENNTRVSAGDENGDGGSYFSKQTVSQSLAKKANVDRFSESSRGESDLLSAQDDCSEHSPSDSYDDYTTLETSDSGTPWIPWLLAGQLTMIGKPKMVLKPKRNDKLNKRFSSITAELPFSLQNLMGTTQSFTLDDIWPWPWLDPDRKSSDEYVCKGSDEKTFPGKAIIKHSKPPLLALTLKGYLESVETCVTDAQFANTKEIVKDFALCIGKTLTDQLLSKVEGSTDWHKRALPNHDYTFTRENQVIQNYGIVVPLFEDLWPPKPDSQVERSVVLVGLILEFSILIFEEKLKPLRSSENKPLCMNSFRRLFSSNRIPGLSEDSVNSYFLTKRQGGTMPKHIVVICKARFFAINVLDSNYKPIKPNTFKEELIRVKQAAHESNEESAVIGLGVLTSTDRDTWYKCREKLIDFNTNNAACLQVLEEALFILSLDNFSVRQTALGLEAVFADGCNRWYDKSLNFYVYDNGLITCNVNRSVQDGWAAAVLLDYVHLRILQDTQIWDDDVVKTLAISMSASQTNLKASDSITQQLRQLVQKPDGIEPVVKSKSIVRNYRAQELVFVLDDELKEEVEQAKFNFVNLQEHFLTANCEYSYFEKDMLGSKNIHPDAFVNLVMHLTFFRMYYRMASIATKVQIKTIYNGGFEILRSTNTETRTWCKAMMDPDSNKSETPRLFRAAEKKLKVLYKRCSAGHSCDSHLTALKLIASETEEEIPDLFLDESYNMSGSEEQFEVFLESFGAPFLSQRVVIPHRHDSYGVGYTLVNSKLFCIVSSWSEEPTTCAELFARSIRRTLEIHHDFFSNL